MSKQILIALGREFASGGHMIAKKISEHFDITLYDKNFVEEIAKEHGVNPEVFNAFDEKKRNILFSRSIGGMTNSNEDILAQMQFDFLKNHADAGESFIVCGRCAEEVLKDNPNLIKIFVLADEQFKIDRIVEFENVSPRQAAYIINRSNKKRKSYHNLYCVGKWGDSRNYDICINSSTLGIDETADFLIKFIESKLAD